MADSKLNAALYDPQRLALVRKALDDELQAQGYTQLRDGHVDLFDGDLNTEELAREVLNALRGQFKP